MSAWFHCAQGGFPLDTASYGLERAATGAPIVHVHVVALSLRPLEGSDAARFLEQVAQAQSHIRWSRGGAPRAQTRCRLLRSEPLALLAGAHIWLLASDEAAAVLRDLGVLRRCDGWRCQGRKRLIFEPASAVCDRCGYRAAGWADAWRTGDALVERPGERGT